MVLGSEKFDFQCLTDPVIVLLHPNVSLEGAMTLIVLALILIHQLT